MKDYFNIKATGKNIELGSFFQKYNLKKLSSVFLKYSANPISANTVLEKRNVFFKVKLDILIDNNIKFETLGRSKIATLALDEAVENISKRLRRHYRKIKNHRLLNNRINNVKEDLIFKNKIGRIRDIQVHPKTGKIYFLSEDSLWLMEKS